MSTVATAHARIARPLAVTLAVVLACLLLGVGGASAADRVKATNHCINPEGSDLNVRYGVTEQIAAPFCARIVSGKTWRVVAFWFTNHTFEVVPEGFIPAGATPFEDFVYKLAAVKYVIDPGTPQEKTVVFPNSHKLWTGVIDGYPTANTVTLGTLRPLRPGEHVIEVHWIFRAMHCDGFGDVLGENCVSAGDLLYDRFEFQVTPGQRR